MRAEVFRFENRAVVSPGSSCMIGRVCQSVALVVLKAYKALISPWLAPCCRFTPSCSDYAGEAIERYGVIRGTGKAVMRLLRCHPFSRGGWDPA